MLTKTSAFYRASQDLTLRDAQDSRATLSYVRAQIAAADEYFARAEARLLVSLYREWPLTVTRALQGTR